MFFNSVFFGILGMLLSAPISAEAEGGRYFSLFELASARNTINRDGCRPECHTDDLSIVDVGQDSFLFGHIGGYRLFLLVDNRSCARTRECMLALVGIGDQGFYYLEDGLGLDLNRWEQRLRKTGFPGQTFIRAPVIDRGHPWRSGWERTCRGQECSISYTADTDREGGIGVRLWRLNGDITAMDIYTSIPILLNFGFRVSIDGGESLAYPIAGCTPQGICYSRTGLSRSRLEAIFAARTINVSVVAKAMGRFDDAAIPIRKLADLYSGMTVLEQLPAPIFDNISILTEISQD